MKFITTTYLESGTTVVLPIEYESKNKFLSDFYIMMENSTGCNFYLGGQTWDKSYFMDTEGNYVLPIVMTFNEWINEIFQKCGSPSAGWFCSRAAGHSGPCAAYPDEAA